MNITSLGNHLEASAAVALFSQIGAFQTALQTALSLGVDMSNVFENLAIRCVQLSGSHSNRQRCVTALASKSSVSR